MPKKSEPKRKTTETSKTHDGNFKRRKTKTQSGRGPGKPTISDDELLEQSDHWTYLLETYWGEVGFRLRHARNLAGIRAALTPISKTGYAYYPFALLVRPGIESANSENISKSKQDLAKAIKRWTEAEKEKNEMAKPFNIAKQAADEISPDAERVLKQRLRETKINLSQKKSDIRKTKLLLEKVASSDRNSLEAQLASLRNECSGQEESIGQMEQRLQNMTPAHREPVSKVLEQRRGALMAAQKMVSESDAEVKAIEARLSDEQAHYCQQQLLAFIQGKRYECAPRRLANAIAGLPVIGCRQSALRCSALRYHKEPGQAYKVFLLVEEVWRKQKGASVNHYFDLFREAVCNLPKNQLMEIPGEQKKKMVENWFRQFLAENWFYLKNAIKQAMQNYEHPDKVPYLVVAKFYENMAKPRFPIDVLTATEQQLKC